MKTRRLGGTDIEISPIGLGCWQFANSGGGLLSFWRELPQETIDHIVAVSLDGGINWFDTAEAYGRGSSESALALGLKTYGVRPGEVVIATKWQPMFRTARSLVHSIDDRLKHLDGFPIDLHQVHMPTSLSSIEKQMAAMVQLLREGKIRAVGVSNFTAAQMRRAHAVLKREGYCLASNQVLYHLLNRRIEGSGVLETARELGITIIAYSPLAQGLLTGKFHNKEEDIQARPGPRKYFRSFQETGLQRTAPLIHELELIGQVYDATPSQVALNWLMHAHDDCVVVIPGASSMQQAAENVKAATFQLTPQEIQRLSDVSLSVIS